MQLRHFYRMVVGIALVGFVLAASGARADGIGKEVWIGGGVSWPEYHDDTAMACLRGGIGAVFFNHVTLGASAQADRDHIYYFADAGLILPSLGLVVPYGRFQVGRRDDHDDTAMGWVGGVRVGDDVINFFVEAHGIFEPEKNLGASAGISF
jgi:hypothetical protein